MGQPVEVRVLLTAPIMVSTTKQCWSMRSRSSTKARRAPNELVRVLLTAPIMVSTTKQCWSMRSRSSTKARRAPNELVRVLLTAPVYALAQTVTSKQRILPYYALMSPRYCYICKCRCVGQSSSVRFTEHCINLLNLFF